MFRIDNDSILNGTKPATDPNDFTLIDVLGSGDGSTPVVGGLEMQQINGYVRKPEIFKGNAEFKGSFGTDAESSEWTMVDRAYYDRLNTPGRMISCWLQTESAVTLWMLSHSSNQPFHPMFIRSVKVISANEQIRGIITDTTVAGFLTDIIMADTGQTLTLKSGMTGAILAATDTLMNGDSLIVQSADMKNTTKYLLEVTDEGLNSDALLVSSEYDDYCRRRKRNSSRI